MKQFNNKTINSLRLFIAINLPKEIKEQIAKLEWEMTKKNIPFRFENDDKLHVTLSFLGNTDIEKIPLLTAVLSDVVKGIPAFMLQIQNLGAFPGFKHPRVLYLSVAGDLQILLKLQKKLLQGLKEKGFRPRSNDAFTPHITLARLMKLPYPIHLKNTGNQIKGLKIKLPKLQFTVDSISLMQSKLKPTGSEYKTIKTVNFSQ